MLLWMGEEGEGEGEGDGISGRRGWMRREERFKGRGIEDVWVWLERDGHSIQPS